MSIDRDASIVSQVAAKIAGDIAVKASQGDLGVTLEEYEIAFTFVRDSLFAAIGFGTITEAFAGTTVATPEEAAAAPAYTAPVAASGALTCAGDQHGPFPAWLEAATAKVGCRKVYDNRGGKFAVLDANGNAINKRPWFKQADQANGADPVAFWPPQQRR